MTARPMIFSAPMIQALLDGTKTQTRRVLNGVPPQPVSRCAPGNVPRHPAPYLDAYCGDKRTVANPRGMSRDWHWWQVDDRPGPVAFRVPCVPGDRLWVREGWRPHYLGDGCWDLDVSYVADGERRRIYDGEFSDKDWNWPKSADRGNVSPIHMPRWASRLTLTVTDVRVQRLQEISEDDARAEGIMRHGHAFTGYGKDADLWMTERNSFASLWNSIHGPDAWDRNDWVCALTFTVEKRNIDAPAGDEGR